MHSRFDGSKPGPGRPKGSRSQDSILKAELNETRIVNINGKPKKVSQRELLAKLWIKQAFEKQRHKDMQQVLDVARRLFPETLSEDSGRSTRGRPQSDQAIIAQLFASLELGESAPGVNDPLKDALHELAENEAGTTEGWQDEDWGTPGVSDQGDDLDDD